MAIRTSNVRTKHKGGEYAKLCETQNKKNVPYKGATNYYCLTLTYRLNDVRTLKEAIFSSMPERQVALTVRY